jgi:prepilin-type processing-associated H-X9-DG protein
MVFIDEGRITIGPYALRYLYQTWWDGPPFHHNSGATLSFADGHVEYWKWEGTETIRMGRQAWEQQNFGLLHGYVPETAEGVRDLCRAQKAVWGRLGYRPAVQ